MYSFSIISFQGYGLVFIASKFTPEVSRFEVLSVTGLFYHWSTLYLQQSLADVDLQISNCKDNITDHGSTTIMQLIQVYLQTQRITKHAN